MDLPNNNGISGKREVEETLRILSIFQASHQQQTPTIGTAANSKASRDLQFTRGGMWFFVFLEIMVFALTGIHAGLLLWHERVGSDGGMGVYSFCIAWLSTYAAGASLLYGFVFSVTLCPPLAISIGFMRPEAAQGSSARLSPTCCGWAFVTVQYLLAAGFTAAMTAEQSRTEHVSPAILFGTAVALFCGAASIITVISFGAVEWTCMGTYLGLTRPDIRASRRLHFTCGGMWFFLILEITVIVVTATHAILLLAYERVGADRGMGMCAFCIAWLSTYAAGASLLYGFVFSVTLCPPLAISIGFMRPEAAQGSSARLSPTCCGWAFVTVQYLLAAGFTAAMTAEQSRTEHVSPAILFGTAVALFCGAASIITVISFGAVEWTCMGTYLGLTRPRTADSTV